MIDDLRYAIRLLVKAPGFSVVAILTLAIGIGVGTAVFSVVVDVLLRPLPYVEPSRLVVVREVLAKVSAFPSLPVNAAHFLQWRRSCRSFEALSAISPVRLALTGRGEPRQLNVARVSANFLSLLGSRPQLGRDFKEGEDESGSDQVVILTDGLWRRVFDADPGAVGSKVDLNGTPFTVIGILPPSFVPLVGQQVAPPLDLGPGTDALIPLMFDAAHLRPTGPFDYGAIGRLKKSVSLQQAASELSVVQARIEADTAGEGRLGLQATILPLKDAVVHNGRETLLFVATAVTVIFLLICVNVGSLAVGRIESRKRELLVRSAVGASHSRIARLVLTEMTLLSLVGGLLGLAFASAWLGVLRSTGSLSIPRLSEVRLDWHVLLVGVIASCAAAVLTGLIPLWGLNDTRQTSARAEARHLKALVAIEAGTATLLLIAASLITRNFIQISSIDRGFQSVDVFSADLALPTPRYQNPGDRNDFYRDLLATLADAPGIEGVGLTSKLPLRGETFVDGVRASDDTRPNVELPLGNFRLVSPGLFQVLGIRLQRGRLLRADDENRAVAVISQTLASHVWRNTDPVGRQFGRGGTQRWEVVGVVSDTPTSAVDNPHTNIVYLPYQQRTPDAVSLVVRTVMDSPAVADTIRRSIWNIDRGLPVDEIRPMDDVVRESMDQRRLETAVILSFSIGALVLVCIGVYGLVALTVGHHTREYSIRLALGAAPWRLVMHTIMTGLSPVTWGLPFGIIGAIAANRILQHVVVLASATTNLAAIVAAVSILLATASTACYVAARRVTRVDPMKTLRTE